MMLHVAGTVSLIRDGDAVVIVDPGLVPSPAAILDPLRALGVAPQDVTDVVFSHHHPDHTVSAALFSDVHIHDVMATYHGDPAGSPGPPKASRWRPASP